MRVCFLFPCSDFGTARNFYINFGRTEIYSVLILLSRNMVFFLHLSRFSFAFFGNSSSHLPSPYTSYLFLYVYQVLGYFFLFYFCCCQKNASYSITHSDWSLQMDQTYRLLSQTLSLKFSLGQQKNRCRIKSERWLMSGKRQEPQIRVLAPYL